VTEVQTRPPHGPRVVRRVLVLVSLIALVDVCFYSAITPLLPSYVDELGLSKSQAGALLGSYALGTLLASLPAGWLAARRGSRPTLLLGLGLLAASSVVFGLGSSFEVLAAARFVQGVSGAASWAAGLAWLVAISPRERRGQLIGTVLGVGIAGAIGGPALGAVAHVLGPAAVFTAVAAIAVGLAAVVLVSPAADDVAPSGGLLRAVRARWVLAGAWLTILASLFFGIFGVLVPLRLDALGTGATGIAAVFLFTAAAEAVASPVAGRLSDRRGRLLPVRAGLLGIVGASLVMPLPLSAWLLGAAAVAAGAVCGLLLAPASVLLSHGAEEAGLAQGLVFGLFNLAWAVGQLTGSAGGARLADLSSDTVPYLVAAALAAVTLLGLWRRPGGGGHRTVGGAARGGPAAG